jgi:hydroxymethylpyrimidine/phosphomethylpyrimidine kinase
MSKRLAVPVVMTFSVSDPTGGGMHADIETLFSLGCRCTSIVTAITAQNSTGLKDYLVTPTGLVIEQTRAILEETTISAFKIGAINNIETLAAIYTVLKDYPNIPIVFNIDNQTVGTIDNPNEEMISAITTLICPLTSLLILDTTTAQILTPGADTIEACAQKLMEYGHNAILIKNHRGNTFKNALYSSHRLLEEFICEQVTGDFHGSSSTLSAAITGLLAHGLVLTEAVIEAQKYTWLCIEQGNRRGLGLKTLTHIFGLKNI